MPIVPFEAMVKHSSEKYPDSNGWEILAPIVTEESTTITSRGDRAVNFEGRECPSCHAADPRCTQRQSKEKTREKS